MEETAKKAKEAVAQFEGEIEQKLILFSLGNADGIENMLANLDTIDENLAPEPVQFQNTKAETCTIFWTSGATGSPKGICHSHFGINHFYGVGKTEILAKDRNQPRVQTTTFFHIGGFSAAIMALEKRQTNHHVSFKVPFIS